MRIKTIVKFLNIPVGSVGEVINSRNPAHVDFCGSCEVKFDCKDASVLLPYPWESHYKEVADES